MSARKPHKDQINAAANRRRQLFACLCTRLIRLIAGPKLCGKAALKAVDKVACELLKTTSVDN